MSGWYDGGTRDGDEGRILSADIWSWQDLLGWCGIRRHAAVLEGPHSRAMVWHHCHDITIGKTV